jgi:hypothetical protein
MLIQVSVGDLLAESNIVLGHTSVAGEVDASMAAEPWNNDDSEDDCITEFEALEDSDAFEEGPSVSIRVNRSTQACISSPVQSITVVFCLLHTTPRNPHLNIPLHLHLQMTLIQNMLYGPSKEGGDPDLKKRDRERSLRNGGRLQSHIYARSVETYCGLLRAIPSFGGNGTVPMLRNRSQKTSGLHYEGRKLGSHPILPMFHVIPYGG